MHLTKKALLIEEKIWLSENEDTDEWFEKGIELYHQLSKIDHFNFAYYVTQEVNLLLEKAKDEKMKKGNMHKAESLLKRVIVIDIEPNHSEIYYRLAFIKSNLKQWEASLFYANEALEHGISLDEEIKLSALMGYAYHHVGLNQKAKEQFDHAKVLDSINKWSYFIERYEEANHERRSMTRQQREESEVQAAEALDKMNQNLCCIISIYSERNEIITYYDKKSLSLKEAELLAYLISKHQKVVSKDIILNHIWPELSRNNPNSTVVKRTISSLRKKLALAFMNSTSTEFISFEDPGYKLSLPVEAIVIKGVNFHRLSCY